MLNLLNALRKAFADKKRLALFVLLCFAAVFLFTAFINIYMVLSTKKYIYAQQELVPSKTAVIVPGAKVYQGGWLSTAFKDRIVSGAELLNAGRAEKILLSGDHGRKTYDEVNTGRNFILNNYPQIAHENIFMDHAGFSTYETTLIDFAQALGRSFLHRRLADATCTGVAFDPIYSPSHLREKG